MPNARGPKDLLAVVPPVGHVIRSAGEFDAEGPGHGGSARLQCEYVCQTCDLADCADRPRARGAAGCECGVARPSVK